MVTVAAILFLAVLSAGCTQVPAAHAPAGTTQVPAGTPVAVSPATTSNETLVAFVKEAAAYAKDHGKDAALTEFSRKNGSFVRGELYIYAYDFDGLTIAHPFNPEKIGVNRINETDALGTLFIKNLRDTARSGSGFVTFSYINPAHNATVEKKLGYVEKVDDTWWLGSGIYFGAVNPAR